MNKEVSQAELDLLRKNRSINEGDNEVVTPRNKELALPIEVIIRTGTNRQGGVYLRGTPREISAIVFEVGTHSQVISYGAAGWIAAKGWLIIFRFENFLKAYEWDGEFWLDLDIGG